MFFIKRNKQRGVTTLEYALIVAMIAVVASTAAKTLGEKTSNSFNKIGDKLCEGGGIEVTVDTFP